MRTIAIEEHFLADGFREVMKREARSEGRGSNAAFGAEQQAKLADLGSTRLKDMDAGGIDLQVISHTTGGGQAVIDYLHAGGIDLQVISHMASGINSLPGGEVVRVAREANDQLPAAVAAHPDRFAGFATLPMTDPEAAADELERAVRSLGLKGAMINVTTHGRFLDDRSFLPILERAVTLSVPIYVHPEVPPAAVREAYYSGFDPAVNFLLLTAGWGWDSAAGTLCPGV